MIVAKKNEITELAQKRSLDTFVWTSGSAQRARGLTGKQRARYSFKPANVRSVHGGQWEKEVVCKLEKRGLAT